ncbi:uncharacterized protein LOC134216829 [Armigeres subalbatus]|uniref:uncharacterized protein LOC134216829 n=1 Tax=Armigeres subalbatus TaxID=124917 RepID=UPI002ED4547D
MSQSEIFSGIQASSSFDIVKALFGDSKKTTDSKSYLSSSGVGIDQQQRSEEIQPAASVDKISVASLFSKSRFSRESRIKQESLILQSLRKISKIPEAFSKETILEAKSSSHCSPATLKNLEIRYDELLPKYTRCMEETREKLLKLGVSTVDKAGKSKPMPVIESLLDQMIAVRSTLSKNRRKLLSNFQKLEHLKIRDALLDLQIKNIRLEELHDLQVEVSRTTEKIDETSKQMIKARNQYESDISKAAHVREKWYAFQNKILIKMDDLNELKVAIYEHRQYLCGLLEQKKQLRKENAELKYECRIIDNKPLLRKYERVLADIEQFNFQIKRFAEL